MMRLEDEGVLAGDRKRKPGFNVRVVRINPEFHAAAPLVKLVEVCAAGWGWTEKISSAFAHLAPRTREHLRRRRLV